ncbi:class I adenylate-forming enzyme family protein [Paenibacillus sp. SAF-054]
MNMVSPILIHAERNPDQIALSDNQRSLSYSELSTRIKKVASGLQKLGLNRDNIAICADNRTEFVEVFLGAVYAGCVPVPLDLKWSLGEIQTVLGHCRPGLFFAEKALLKDLDTMGLQVYTFTDESEGSYDRWLDLLLPDGELAETNELLFIGFTSGTTGMPKGYSRTHRSWIRSFEATREAFGLVGLEHHCAPGPFVHSLSLFALMQTLYVGATFHVMRQFDAGEVLRLCSRFPDMVLFVVPTMIEALTRQAAVGSTKIGALLSGGGTWPETSKETCMKVFPQTKLYEYYGSSEASYIAFMDIAEQKPKSVGRPFPGVEVSIRDDHFHEVPDGNIGQLYVRSGMVFRGYYGMPDETADVFRDGWLRLGDYAFMDLEGYLYIAGRAKNMIVSGGMNVFPEEVESVLLRLPEIKEVMVYGTADDYWGEIITAAVQWNGCTSLSQEEIKTFCRRHLASYKTPKQLVTVDEFIYTGSGKIARQAMRDMLSGGLT